MDRKKELERAFQRGHLLNLKNKQYRNWIRKFIVDETKGDIGIRGDITSNALFNGNDKVIEAKVISRSKGVVAGIEEVTFLYRNNGIKVKNIKKDGEKINVGDTILMLKGRVKDLLKIERSASDLMERMSGIATLTDNLIKRIGKRVDIAPTRKTQWRYLDKKAVFVGGGLTHRLALWESILIKDNHLRVLKKYVKFPIEVAIEKAWKNRDKAIFIEIEVNNKEDAISAAKKFKKLKAKSNRKPCFIMFDNMKPSEIKLAIEKLKSLDLYDYVLLEASGGINPENIVEYARTGVDVISLGYLTHSSRALNIKQEII